MPVRPPPASTVAPEIDLARTAAHDDTQDPQDIVIPFTLVVRENTVA
ncbi:hypothetical protein GCM10010399_77560 [Dactylosporangium fulvum]